MRAEYDALRRIAHLASQLVELDDYERDGVAGAATLEELRLALADIQARFPYALETTVTPALVR